MDAVSWMKEEAVTSGGGVQDGSWMKEETVTSGGGGQDGSWMKEEAVTSGAGGKNASCVPLNDGVGESIGGKNDTEQKSSSSAMEITQAAHQERLYGCGESDTLIGMHSDKTPPTDLPEQYPATFYNNKRCYSCPICPKTYTRSNGLNAHMSTVHIGETPFACDACPAAFNRRDKLTEHRRIHLAERVFMCNVCSKTFSRGYKLKMHSLLHLKDQLAAPPPPVIETKETSPLELLDVCFENDKSHIPEEETTLNNDQDTESGRSSSAENNMSDCRDGTPLSDGQRDSSSTNESFNSNASDDTQHIESSNCDTQEEPADSSSGTTKLEEEDTSPSKNQWEEHLFCKTCETGFPDEAKFNEHMLIHSTKKYHKCKLCSRVFSRSNRLIAHMFIHTGKKPFACNLCTKSFTRRDKLNDHRLRVHSIARPPPSRRTKRNASPDDLSLHELVFAGQDPTGSSNEGTEEEQQLIKQRQQELLLQQQQELLFQQQQQELLVHQQQQELILQEQQQEETLTQQQEEENTVKTPEPDQPAEEDPSEENTVEQEEFRCTICLQGFTDPTSLQLHLAEHSGKKLYKCTMCPKTFSRPNRLEAHMCIHTGEKPFACDKCSKAFTRRDRLNDHRIRVHETESLLYCNICSKTFISHERLVTHMQLHKKQYLEGKMPPVAAAVYESMQMQLADDQNSNDMAESNPADGNDNQETCLDHAHFLDGSSNSSSAHFMDLSTDDQNTDPPSVDVHLIEAPQSIKSLEDVASDRVKLLENAPGEKVDHSLQKELPSTNSSVFICDVCKISFDDPFALKKHRLVHDNRRTYKCDVCPKTFSRTNRLYAHSVTHRGQKQQLTCDVCDKSFTRRDRLHEHKLRHHPEVMGSELLSRCDSLLSQTLTHETKRSLEMLSTEVLQRLAKAKYDEERSNKARSKFQPKMSYIDVSVNVASLLTCDVDDVKQEEESSYDLGTKEHPSETTENNDPDGIVIKETLSGDGDTRTQGHIDIVPVKKRRVMQNTSGEITPKKEAITQCNDGEDSEASCSSDDSGTSMERLQCKSCKETFEDKESLQKHRQLHERRKGKKKSYSCTLCPKIFSRSNGLHTHMLSHTGERPFRCDLCKRSFTRKDRLRDHKVHLHPESLEDDTSKVAAAPDTTGEPNLHELVEAYYEEYGGEEAAAMFRQEGENCNDNDYLDIQEQLAPKCELIEEDSEVQRSYACNLCPKSYTRPDRLRAHMVVHTGERPFHCDLCSKSFSRSDSLKEHRRSHVFQFGQKVESKKEATGESPGERDTEPNHLLEAQYTCKMCGMHLPEEGSLEDHMAEHKVKQELNKKKSYKCTLCSKVYPRLDRLRAHMSLHTGEKPFACDLCPKSFARKDSLLEHRRSHTEYSPAKCTICFKSFTRGDKLRKHYLIHEEELLRQQS